MTNLKEKYTKEIVKKLKEEFKLIMKEHTLNHDRKDLRKL